MKTLALSLLTILSISSAFASTEDGIVLVCEKTGFSDLQKIEIEEFEKGRYVLVQTLRNPCAAKDEMNQCVAEIQYMSSQPFGIRALHEGNFPSLARWYGSARTLIRNGENNYMIELNDSLHSVQYTSIQCKESF